MWRYLAGGAAVIAMAGAGVLLSTGQARHERLLPEAPAAQQQTAGTAGEPASDAVPEASPRTREQKRFGRYDKDRDGRITREEYLAHRRKAYAKLDANGDGQLSFDEWSSKAIAKFGKADADRSGAMNASEFASTAVKRKARVPCPRPSAAVSEEES